MKTYKIKNYKGNLVESLSKFQKSHKGMKIVEACEDGDDLKVKAEESKLEEASGKKAYVVVYEPEDGKIAIIAVCTNKSLADKIVKEGLKKLEDNGEETDTKYGEVYSWQEVPMDKKLTDEEVIGYFDDEDGPSDYDTYW